MGIGVNTGEAVVGNIGSEQRAKYAVVGSAVNIAARVEGATVGGQVFITAATYERIEEVADVSVPQAVEVKGLSEPLMLYDLHAIRGRYAQAAVAEEGDAEPEVDVSLPIRCWVIEGKIISAEAITGQVLRLGRREIQARLDTPLAPLTNVRFRLGYQSPAGESADIYGKVIRDDQPAMIRDDHAASPPLTRIRFTSITDTDTQTIESLIKTRATT